jgi:hypothetical protein
MSPMLRPRCYITFTNAKESIEFDYCQEFHTEESYETLTNTATIIMPRKFDQFPDTVFTGQYPLFKRKDKVKIEAGYNKDRILLFEGFITKVGINVPVEIQCEDYMFIFKQYTFTYPQNVCTLHKISKKGKTLKSTYTISEDITLKALMENIFNQGNYRDLLDGISYELVDKNINLGQVRFNNITPAKAFEKLKDDYGLYTYFIGKVLYIGFANNAVDTKTRNIKLEEAAINYNSLEFQNEEDILIKVKCVSMLKDNTKLEGEFGDDAGELRTYHFYNIKDVNSLIEIAKKRAEALKYTGLKGNLLTFGAPYLRHGDIAKLSSTSVAIRGTDGKGLDGKYLIKAVKRSFGVSIGYRQSLELGAKID